MMEKKVFNIRNGLIAGFILLGILLAALLYTIIAPFYTQTDVRSRIQVFSADTRIQVPGVITVGQPYKYEAFGTKLVNTGTIIKNQMTCLMPDGSTSIYSIAEAYSNAPQGSLSVVRTQTIPVSVRLMPSDKCYMEFYGVYSFYVTQFGGREQQVDVPAVIRSNDFKLVVPTTQ